MLGPARRPVTALISTLVLASCAPATDLSSDGIVPRSPVATPTQLVIESVGTPVHLPAGVLIVAEGYVSSITVSGQKMMLQDDGTLTVDSWSGIEGGRVGTRYTYKAPSKNVRRMRQLLECGEWKATASDYGTLEDDTRRCCPHVSSITGGGKMVTIHTNARSPPIYAELSRELDTLDRIAVRKGRKQELPESWQRR